MARDERGGTPAFSRRQLLQIGGAASIATVLPGATAGYTGKATMSLWQRSQFQGLSYSYWKPGQYQAFSGYERVRQGGGNATSVATGTKAGNSAASPQGRQALQQAKEEAEQDQATAAADQDKAQH